MAKFQLFGLKQGMNPKQHTHLCGILVIVFSSVTAFGQSVLVSPPPPPTEAEPAEQSTDTSAEGASGMPGAGTPGDMNPFRWGPVVLHPRLTYGLSYGSGLQSQPGRSHETLIQTLSPSLGATIGKHWHLGYSAAATFYSDSAFHNSVDHSFSLDWQTTYEDWSFRLGQTVSISSDPQVQTAQQTDQQIYSTTLGLSFPISSDLSVDFSVGQTITDVSSFNSASSGTNGFSTPVGGTGDWSAMGWLNYHWGPYFSTGLGVGGGYNQVSIGPNMTYEDYQGRITWRFAQKVSLSVNGGAQVRQFRSDQPDILTPTFGVGLSYRPFDRTVLTIGASRSMTASYYFANQVTETTSFTLGLSQQLFGKYSLGMSGGYAISNYRETSIFGSSSREDNYSFFSVGVSRGFLTHGTATVSYSTTQNSSSLGGYTYGSSQVGLSLSYGY